MDDDKPHIAFTMTGDRVVEALTTLGVAAAPTARNATGHHSGWPGQEQWASYMGGTSEWLHGLLPDDERHRIEAKLSSLETDYNNWLHASQGGASAGGIDDLRDRVPRGGVASGGATSVTGSGRDSQATRVGRLTVSSSPIGAMLSSVI